MPAAFAWSLTAAEDVTLLLAVTLVVLLALIGYRKWQNSRVTPEERERRRRTLLAAHGKMADATLLEAREGLLFYAYMVRGMEYTASQDVSLLKAHLPAEFSAVGPVSVKYDPRKPANSIVLAESWSGLHAVKPG